MTLTIKPGFLASHAQERGYTGVADLSQDLDIRGSRLMSLADGAVPTSSEVAKVVISLDSSMREAFMYAGTDA